ncbi:phosphonate ABC transporter, permease protein PhnE [Baia soyae]|uniref:Phosphonate transport system permease protein n=1 Tax=Baia soyae TaxID=1544746 RepID=A0A4R2S0E0_9BACL|nr:phosphonate ABC transporter, permease protein PhnE [Baia soyae]TCP69392.1 phosphonate transport system permease protein [Baia soyae]
MEQQIAALKKPRKTKHLLTVVLLLILFYASSYNTKAYIEDLISGLPNMQSILVKMASPDWSYFEPIITPVLDTIRMAFIGTLLGAILSIPVAFLAANNLFGKWVTIPARFILNIIRAIPELLIAALFVAIFGMGMIPGILAIAFFSMGIISKLLYESIETIDPGPLEAMTAVGSKKLVWIRFAVIPQVLASFTSYVLYTFEINVRAAAILGYVGAGGIGINYERVMGFLEYQKLSTIVFAMFVVVVIIDWISTKLRERLV